MKDFFFFLSDKMWPTLCLIFQNADMIAALTAIAALIYSMKTFKDSVQRSHYDELDRMYLDLLKTALEHSHVYKPASISAGQTKLKEEYDIYAFMVWNFLEAVYDRCKENKVLCDTWYPIIDAESRLHREWFDRPENEHKFKVNFIEFIRNGKFKEFQKITILKRAISGKLINQEIKSVALISIVKELVDGEHLRAAVISSEDGPKFIANNNSKKYLKRLEQVRYLDKAKKFGNCVVWFLVICLVLIIVWYSVNFCC